MWVFAIVNLVSESLSSYCIPHKKQVLCPKITVLLKINIISNEGMPAKYQICEQALNTLHHINKAKPLAENSAMARLRDILSGLGPADPRNTLKRYSFHKTENGTTRVCIW